MEKILTEMIGEKYVTTIIMDYVEDLEKYEKLQNIDNRIVSEMEDMVVLIELNTKPVKHLISKKLLRLEQEMGVNVSCDSDSDFDDDNEDSRIKRYYEKKIGIDDYDLQYCRDTISRYSKDRYILLGKDEFDKTPIIKRDDFEESDSEIEIESDSDDDMIEVD